MSAYSAMILATSGLVGYWRLGETSGTTAVDASTGAHDGTIAGSPTMGVPSLIANDPADRALSLDGVNDSISLGNTFGFAGNVPYSIEGLFKTTAYSASVFPVLVSKRVFVGPGYDGWSLYTGDSASSGYLGFARNFADGTSQSVDATASLGATVGQTVHVVGTYDGTSLRLYRNGLLIGGPTASASALATNTANTRIGANEDFGATNFYNGVADEIAIYSRALTLTEIATHAAAAFAAGGIAPGLLLPV